MYAIFFYVLLHLPIINAETQPQGARSDEISRLGSLHQTPFSTIFISTAASSMGPRSGLPKTIGLMNGRRAALYYGSVAIVSSLLCLGRVVINFYSDSAGGSGKSVLWYVTPQLL